MKITATAKDLKDSLGLTGLTVDKRKGANPTCSVLITAVKSKKEGQPDRILLFSTDGIGRMLCKTDGEVSEDTRICVDHALLATTVGSLNDSTVVEATVTSSSNGAKTLVVKAENVRMRLPHSEQTVPVMVEWQKSLQIKKQASIVVPTDILRKALDQVGSFCMTDGDHEIFRKVKVVVDKNGTEAFATNKAVVALFNTNKGNESDDSQEVVFPSRAISALQKLLDKCGDETVDVIIDKKDEDVKSVFVRTSGACYGTASTGFNYVDLKKIAGNQKNVIQLRVDRDELKRCVNRCREFSSDRERYTKIAISGSKIKVIGEITGQDCRIEQELQGSILQGDTSEEKVYQLLVPGTLLASVLNTCSTKDVDMGLVINEKQQLVSVEEVTQEDPEKPTTSSKYLVIGTAEAAIEKKPVASVGTLTSVSNAA